MLGARLVGVKIIENPQRDDVSAGAQKVFYLQYSTDNNLGTLRTGRLEMGDQLIGGRNKRLIIKDK